MDGNELQAMLGRGREARARMERAMNRAIAAQRSDSRSEFSMRADPMQRALRKVVSENEDRLARVAPALEKLLGRQLSELVELNGVMESHGGDALLTWVPSFQEWLAENGVRGLRDNVSFGWYASSDSSALVLRKWHYCRFAGGKCYTACFSAVADLCNPTFEFFSRYVKIGDMPDVLVQEIVLLEARLEVALALRYLLVQIEEGTLLDNVAGRFDQWIQDN